jgi:hypothetical protein
MCRTASFLYKNKSELEIRVYQLESHSETQSALKLTEAKGWYEGHYTPDGKVECRSPSGRDIFAEKELKRRYPTFNRFLKWALKQKLNLDGNLDLTAADLSGIKFPDTINGSLCVMDCDLKGIKFPNDFKGNLYIYYCDLKGIKLPSKIDGNFQFYGCTMKDVVKFPKVKGCLDLRGCDLTGIKLPSTLLGSLDLRGCDLKGVKLPSKIGRCLNIGDCKNINKKMIKGMKVGMTYSE